MNTVGKSVPVTHLRMRGREILLITEFFYGRLLESSFTKNNLI